MLLRVTLGGVSRDDLRTRLQRAGMHLNPAAVALFDDARFAPSPQQTEVTVALRDVASLGLPEGGTFAAVVAAAASRGLSPCPLELGPHLRLQWTDQPEGSVGHAPTKHRAPPGSVTVASPPLDDTDETPKGFYLRRIDGALWLRGYRAPLDHRWSPDDVFAFAHPTSNP